MSYRGLYSGFCRFHYKTVYAVSQRFIPLFPFRECLVSSKLHTDCRLATLLLGCFHILAFFWLFVLRALALPTHPFSLKCASCFVLCCLKASFHNRLLTVRHPLSLWLSPRPISDSQLHTLLYFHLCPIYLMFSKGSYRIPPGISHLKGGFTLRCLQRLSLPDLATRPCPWQDNRYTRGQSIPVLSY